jgi:hypothetical protein
VCKFMDTPIPLEQSDPDLAKIIEDIVNGRGLIRGFTVSVHGRSVRGRNGSLLMSRTQRNASCPCGSKKKYKKCCGA